MLHLHLPTGAKIRVNPRVHLSACFATNAINYMSFMYVYLCIKPQAGGVSSLAKTTFSLFIF